MNTKQLILVYLKSSFTWAPCILSNNPTVAPRETSEVLVGTWVLAILGS